MVLEIIRFVLVSLFMVAALFTLLTGVLGAFRFKYVMNRMHAAAINDTLGILLATIALIIAQGPDFVSLKLLLAVVFLWLTSPVSSHLIARLEITVNENREKEMEVRGE